MRGPRPWARACARTSRCGSCFSDTTVSVTKASARLRRPWINNNRIGIEGGRELVNMLLVNRSIFSVFLVNNQLGDAGVQAFIPVASANPVIREISVMGNGAFDETEQALAAALDGRAIN
eukprot:m.137506 g.137506  ORF g.137506 m.137506 type:complete len:120 (+) comp9571_c0_seq2:422-781(+)